MLLPTTFNTKHTTYATNDLLGGGWVVDEVRGVEHCLCVCTSGESNRPPTPILLKSIAIHLPFLSRYFCKGMASSWQKVVYTPPICIMMPLPFVSRYICRSIRVRGRLSAPSTARVTHVVYGGTVRRLCIGVPARAVVTELFESLAVESTF